LSGVSNKKGRRRGRRGGGQYEGFGKGAGDQGIAPFCWVIFSFLNLGIARGGNRGRRYSVQRLKPPPLGAMFLEVKRGKRNWGGRERGREGGTGSMGGGRRRGGRSKQQKKVRRLLRVFSAVKHQRALGERGGGVGTHAVRGRCTGELLRSSSLKTGIRLRGAMGGAGKREKPLGALGLGSKEWGWVYCKVRGGSGRLVWGPIRTLSK